MDKKTGTTVTIIVAVVVLLCCTAPLCLGGIMLFTGTGTWSSDFGMPQTGNIPPAYGIIPCCLSILVLIVPVLLWVFLVRNKENGAGGTPTAQMDV